MPILKKKHTKRKLTKQQRRRRNIAIAVAVVSLALMLPLAGLFALWWQGLLPTREELPRYKERLAILLSGRRHARLPEGEVIGIDISHYQGAVSWEELSFHTDNSRRMYKRAGKKTQPRQVDFVVVKATQGARNKDPYYERNKQGAREQGILFGAYHFYSYQAGAHAQAQHFIRSAALQQGDLAPVLDVEPYKGKMPPQDSVLCWLRMVERYYRTKPIVYTNESCYRIWFMPYPAFDGYPFWIARYGGNEPTRQHIIWQCSENGRAGGISRPVDLNVFRGSMSDLKGLYVIR
ncbi:MAG: hypothetical protein IJ169_05120 [Paludibacteraceae bacterium]|nr:hypothetical protein [Paludibacteraceae bacterium]